MRKHFAIAAIFVILLSACYLPVKKEADDPETLQTAIAQTVVVRKTENAFATIVADLTAMPPTVPPIVITATPPGTPPAAPTTGSTTPGAICDWASLIEDVTVPDDTVLQPGQSFTKTWRFKNIGSCSWTPDYSIAFVSGASLNAPASIRLNTTITPGSTMDISVPMTAPTSAGSYTSNWIFKNAVGTQFGLGSSARSGFWVKITVDAPKTIDPNNPLDFVHNMCAMQWRSNAGTLPCPSARQDFANGSIYKVDNPKLEGGYQEDEPAIITIPANGSNGFISGRYPTLNIQNGDIFRALIGCLYGSPNCNVQYQVSYIANGGNETSLGTWNEILDGEWQNIDIDLSFLAGQSVELILTVRNNGASADDRAYWVVPRIERR